MRTALVIAAVGFVSACGGDRLFGAGSDDLRVTLSVDRLDFTAVGDSLPVHATLAGRGSAAPRSGSLRWTTSDSAVVRVLRVEGFGGSPDAVLLRAMGAGVADVTVRYSGARSARLAVAVTQAPTRIDVAVLGSRFLGEVDAQRNASAIVRDRRGHAIAGASVQWESSSPSVATISPQGVISAAGSGSTEIVARAESITSPPLAIEVLVGTGLPPAPATTIVSAGSTFCGIGGDGVTYCVGRGHYGMLGNGSSTDAADPVPVAGGHRFVTLSSGDGGLCGVAADGAGYCWGGNYGLPINPTPVASALGVRELSRHYGWFSTPGPYGGIAGPNTSLQYGLTSLRTDGTFSFSVFADTGLVSQLPFRTLHSVLGQSCGIAVNGALYCWSHDGIRRAWPFRRPFGVGAFTAVTFASDHTCALDAAGVASCVGDNTRGQLGDGTTVARATPVPVAGGHRFTQIVSGFRYTCGLTTVGVAYCWGQNDRGQLGDGGLVDRTVPTRVAGAMSFVALTPGSPTCGLTAEGAAYCWGTQAPTGAAHEWVTEPTRVAPTLTFRVP